MGGPWLRPPRPPLPPPRRCSRLRRRPLGRGLGGERLQPRAQGGSVWRAGQRRAWRRCRPKPRHPPRPWLALPRSPLQRTTLGRPLAQRRGSRPPCAGRGRGGARRGAAAERSARGRRLWRCRARSGRLAKCAAAGTAGRRPPKRLCPRSGSPPPARGPLRKHPRQGVAGTLLPAPRSLRSGCDRRLASARDGATVAAGGCEPRRAA